MIAGEVRIVIKGPRHREVLEVRKYDYGLCCLSMRKYLETNIIFARFFFFLYSFYFIIILFHVKMKKILLSKVIN